MSFLQLALPTFALFALTSCAITVVPASDDRPHETSVACAFGSQCISGACSADWGLGMCGHCLETVPLGGPCGTEYRSCGPHAACDDGICKTSEIPFGEPCPVGPKSDDLGWCTDAGYCSRPTTSQAQTTCRPLALLGQSCTRYQPGTPCQLGAACEAGVCIPDVPRQLGESCEQARCDPALICDSGICRTPQLMLGAACGIFNGISIAGGCAEGLRCGNLQYPNGGGGQTVPNTCLPLPKAGEPCLIDDCFPGLVCEQTYLPNGSASLPMCIVPHAEGEKCGSSQYTPMGVCQAGLECRAQVCRSACR